MKCRVCGCTDFEPCVSAGGETCAWIEDNLCDFCEGKEVRLYTEGDLNRELAFRAAGGDR